MDYQIESVEQINGFTVTNYVPTQLDDKIQRQIILLICNIFSNDHNSIDTKVKNTL